MVMLTAEQVQFYEENGYVVVDVLTEAEMEEFSQEYDHVFKSKSNFNLECTWQGDWLEDSKRGEMTVKSIHGLQMHSAVFTRTLMNPNLLDACQSLMKTPNILLHHTKAHNKPPGNGSPFPMHQDYYYFPYKNDSIMALFFCLDDMSPENGGLCVYPGSHKLGPLEDVSDDPKFHYLDSNKYPLEKATPLTIKRGQIIIFSYLLIHGSYANKSVDKQRRMFLAQVVAGEDVPLVEGIHKSPAQGLVLRGRNPRREADITKRVSEE